MENAIKLISYIDQRNKPFFQGIVKGAYIMMTAIQVGYKIDFNMICSAIRDEKAEVSSLLQIENIIDPKIFFRDGVSNVFFNLDVYMYKKFGNCPDIDERSLDFTYESLCKLSSQELSGLKSLIDRLQIMICSSMFYQDFEEAFLRLSKLACGAFLDRSSNFDISRFGTPRGRVLLAMYRATTESTFFQDKAVYNKFIKLVLVWLFNTINLISKILKPSHKLKDESRYYLDSPMKTNTYSVELTLELQYLLNRYEVLQGTVQSFHPVDLKSFCDNLYMATIKDLIHLLLDRTSQGMGIYYRVRKVLFELLLGGEWNFKKNLWTMPTREAIFFEHLGHKYNGIRTKNWIQPRFHYDKAYKRHWEFNFRRVGPESKGQIQEKILCMAYLLNIKIKWCALRDQRIQIGYISPRASNTELLNAPNLCFPNSMLFANVSYPLILYRIFLNFEDHEIYLDPVDILYHNLMNTMQHSLDICSYDLYIDSSEV